MGRKAGSGDGTIFKNGKNWRGQIYLGGERISVSGKTRQEVSDRLAELRVQYRRGEYVKRNDVTVEEWVREWLVIKVKPNVEPATYYDYESKMINHLYPYIGNIKLQDLDRMTIEAAYAEAFKPEHKKARFKEKGFSLSTAKTTSGLFKRSLQYAVDCNILAKNPHNGVELARFKPPKQTHAHSKEEQKLIIEKCKYATSNQRIFYFLISTGMRFGEAAALSWDDIDLHAGRININKTTTIIDGKTQIKQKTKTQASVRTIFVGENVRDWLKWHKKHSDNSLKNLVFPNRNGNPLILPNSSNSWKLICADLGVEYMGIHALRHTWATRALEAGIDIKTVSQMLGHADIVTTMNIYQHVLDDQKIRAACTLNALF